MKRRDLFVTALTGTAAIATLPRSAQAAPAAWTNVLYTQDNPGHWKGREATHAPVVEINGGKITVRTPHAMSEAHYIVSHSVTLDDGTFVDRKTFTWKDEPVSEFSLPAGYKGGVTVASTCNLHDTWIREVKV
jgi:superoxide reductase